MFNNLRVIQNILKRKTLRYPSFFNLLHNFSSLGNSADPDSIVNTTKLIFLTIDSHN